MVPRNDFESPSPSKCGERVVWHGSVCTMDEKDEESISFSVKKKEREEPDILALLFAQVDASRRWDLPYTASRDCARTIAPLRCGPRHIPG